MIDRLIDHVEPVDGLFAIHAESDQAAIQRVIADHLIPLRNAGAIKGRVEVRCGGVRPSMRAE